MRTDVKIAVVIPARNEEQFIAKCLDSFIASNYPKEKYCVFVVDGLSDDATQNIVKEYEAQCAWIKLLVNTQQTTPFAFNMGIEAAKGYDVLVTVGAHSEIYPDFFETIVNAFAFSPEIGCVGGVLENIYENETAECIGKAMASPFGVGNAHFRTGEKEGYVDTVGFPAYAYTVFEKVGVFNTALVRNQDDEFNYRVNNAGYKIYLSKSIRAKYHVRASFGKLWKQYFQYGYWKVYVNTLHKTVTTTRQLIPPAFVLFLVVGLVLSFCSAFLAGIYVAILCVYAIGAFYFAAQQTQHIKTMLKVVYAFWCMHVSYGIGYLEGVFDFTLRGKKPSNKAKELTR